jgi:alpha-glucosidase (family GH31 glycosyl hydrolase)
MNFSKQYIYNQDGQLTIVDERNFNDCKNQQLKCIKEKAMELILAIAPDYKQRNAALGLLSEQETQQIKDNIQNIRNISNVLEQQILSVTWDETEETRAASCDAVQNVCWP